MVQQEIQSLTINQLQQFQPFMNYHRHPPISQFNAARSAKSFPQWPTKCIPMTSKTAKCHHHFATSWTHACDTARHNQPPHTLRTRQRTICIGQPRMWLRMWLRMAALAYHLSVAATTSYYLPPPPTSLPGSCYSTHLLLLDDHKARPQQQQCQELMY
jgi:hypothetical protein